MTNVDLGQNTVHRRLDRGLLTYVECEDDWRCWNPVYAQFSSIVRQRILLGSGGTTYKSV